MTGFERAVPTPENCLLARRHQSCLWACSMESLMCGCLICLGLDILSNPCVQVSRERCRKSPGSRMKLDLYRVQAKGVTVNIRWQKSKNWNKKWFALIIKFSSTSLIWREKKPLRPPHFYLFGLLIPGKAEVKHWLLQRKVLCFPQCRNFHKEPFCVIERNIF